MGKSNPRMWETEMCAAYENAVKLSNFQRDCTLPTHVQFALFEAQWAKSQEALGLVQKYVNLMKSAEGSATEGGHNDEAKL